MRIPTNCVDVRQKKNNYYYWSEQKCVVNCNNEKIKIKKK